MFSLEQSDGKFYIRNEETNKRVRIRDGKGRDTGIDKSWFILHTVHRALEQLNAGENVPSIAI